MKTKLLKLIFACFLVSMVSCDVDKITSLKDEFKFSASPDAVGSKISIEVADEDSSETIIPNATITFEGEGVESIYTPAGKTVFETTEGFLSVGLLKEITPTVEQPAIFNVTIEAPGYTTLEKELVFDGEDAKIVSYRLRKEGVLAEGSQLVSQLEILGDNSETTSTITVDGSSEAEEPMTFIIEPGTTFEDEDGNQIVGNELKIDVQTFNTQIDLETESFDDPSASTLSNIPDGGFIIEEENSDQELADETEGVSETRASLADGSKTTTTFFPIGNPGCFYLYVNGRRVYYFSQDTKVRTYFSDYSSVINPFTNTQAQVGDVVDVYRRVRKYYSYRYWSWWSRSYRTGYRYRYTNQPTGKKGVVKIDGSGRAYVEYTARYGGVHYFGFTGENVSGCSPESFESLELRNTGRLTWYYCVLRSAVNNKYLGFSWMSSIGENRAIYKNSLDSYRYKHLKKLYNTGVKLTIYGYNYTDGRFEKVYDKETTLCDLATENPDIRTSECVFDYNLEMKVDCPSVSVVFDNTPIYYKKEGDRWFRYFHSIRNGSLTGDGPCLEDNENYQFRLYYDREWHNAPIISGKTAKEIAIDFNMDKVCEIIEAN